MSVRNALALLALISFGCAAANPGRCPEKRQVSRSPIVGGERTESSDDYTVLLRINDNSICSGVLIDPRVVLTARHCVSELTVPGSIHCNVAGQSLDGWQVGNNFEPSNVAVFVGPSPDWTSNDRALARGSFFLTLDDPTLCDRDIAFVFLDAPVYTAPTARVRLSGTVPSSLSAIGYGATEGGALGHRHRRDGVRPLGVGKPGSGRVAIGPRELETTTSICGGDSGGPIVDPSNGEVIGIASRGIGCDSPDGQVFTLLSPFKDMFEMAYAWVGKSSVDGGIRMIDMTMNTECTP